MNYLKFFPTFPRQGGASSFTREVNHNRIAPASPEQKLLVPCDDTNTNHVAVCFATNEPTEIPILNHTVGNNSKHSSSDTSGIHENSPNKGKKPRKKKSPRLCCFGVIH